MVLNLDVLPRGPMELDPCLFNLVSFAVQKLFSLMKSQLVNVCFSLFCFWSQIEKFIAKTYAKELVLYQLVYNFRSFSQDFKQF